MGDKGGSVASFGRAYGEDAYVSDPTLPSSHREREFCNSAEASHQATRSSGSEREFYGRPEPSERPYDHQEPTEVPFAQTSHDLDGHDEGSAGSERSTPRLSVPRDRARYAPWPARVLSWLIDIAIPALLIVAGVVLGWPTTTTTRRDLGDTTIPVTTQSGYQAWLYVFIAVAAAFDLWNRGYREGTTGCSLGKQVTGYHTVLMKSGQRPGPIAGIIRAFLTWLDFAIFYLGVLWPLWDDKRQTLISDKVTGAIVLKRGR